MPYQFAHVGRTRPARSPYLEPLEGRPYLSGAGGLARDVGLPAAEVEASPSASSNDPGTVTEGSAYSAASSLARATEATVAPASENPREDGHASAGADNVTAGETNNASESSSSSTAAIAMPSASVPTVVPVGRGTSDKVPIAGGSASPNDDGSAETLHSVSTDEPRVISLSEDDSLVGSEIAAPAPVGAARSVAGLDSAVKGDEGAPGVDEVKVVVPNVVATIAVAVRAPGDPPPEHAPTRVEELPEPAQAEGSIDRGPDGAPAQPPRGDGEPDAGAGVLSRAADVLASCAPFDRGSLERAIDEFLGRFYDLDPGLPGPVQLTGIVPSVVIVTAGVCAAEAARRRLRKPWDCEDDRADDNRGDSFPGLPGRRQRWALEEL